PFDDQREGATERVGAAQVRDTQFLTDVAPGQGLELGGQGRLDQLISDGEEVSDELVASPRHIARTNDRVRPPSGEDFSIRVAHHRRLTTVSPVNLRREVECPLATP